MPSMRFRELLEASGRSSQEHRQSAAESILGWASITDLARTLREQSNDVAWPPPAVSYGAWPDEHMAAARLQALLTAYSTRPSLATAAHLLAVDDDIRYWLAVARVYLVLGTVLPRLTRRKGLGQCTEFDALDGLEVQALAEALDLARCPVSPIAVPVPERRYGVFVVRDGALELETPSSIAAMVEAGSEPERSARLTQLLMRRVQIEPEEWSGRVERVAAVVNSDQVQFAIGEVGVRAAADKILAGLTGASSATVRRRSVDISKLLPSKFTWECRPGE